jgi:hypothetical protein
MNSETVTAPSGEGAGWLAEYLRAGFEGIHNDIEGLSTSVNRLASRVDTLEAGLAPLVAAAGRTQTRRDHLDAAIAHALVVIPFASLLGLIGGLVAAQLGR